ncbi:Powdery mildew resistance protein, RPW8 domain containing protein [Trema orientale]|uniref:Powdery mildew resistance protein, RPW8 domain containing protein n=1 Tax=Trema orientale TaxID=63057 RepID=A0A2P5FY68_TREOI|nr:Powdery mildew resistance protein, RPW8 domain containing protein [Trema orientale]
MAEIVLEAALGVACESLLKAIRQAERGVCMFDSDLTELDITVEHLKPKVDEIDRLRKKIGDSSNNEMCEFLRGAEQLVKTCSEVAWWNFLKKCKYSKKLKQLNASLRRLIEIDLQFDLAIGIVEISVQMEELRRLVLLEFQERKSNASSRGIFGRSRTAKILRRNRFAV